MANARTPSFFIRTSPFLRLIPLTRTRGKGGLHTLAGMLIKKASGRCANTNPTDTARYTRSHMLRGFSSFCFAPARCQPDGGLCFAYIRDEARRAEQRNVSSARTMMRFMAANSFTLTGVCAVSAHGVTA